MEKVTKSTDLPCASKNDMETLLVLKVLPRLLMLVLNASGLSPRSYPLLRFGWPRSGIRKGQTEDAKPSWPLESVRTLSPHAYFEKHGEGFKSVASFWTKTSPLDPEKKNASQIFRLFTLCYLLPNVQNTVLWSGKSFPNQSLKYLDNIKIPHHPAPTVSHTILIQSKTLIK